VKVPVKLAGTLPEFNRIALIFGENLMEIAKDGHSLTLVRVRRCVEYFISCMDGISNNNNFGNILLGTCLIDTTPDRKEFCFSGCDKDSMVQCFD